ncbi:MAG: mechanosensitive ion channel [Polaromonas sp.]|uniref:mechanosensitive ion channel family protein n=1 Tax=Polaromonas sp. TaxID=1869339 RepID=UPI00272F19D9|nr:mechanosensitive ion channel domain-containing protein [Polaromonas sp.]MDP1740752.1 mechanosensitive ion channel [Polaromonas sp.]MDP1954505.1 mechanosensitive ion channel [Polaromonas sp.]MDP3356976.1 mechanosensitive ion channel [Polaromonas sp.]MDP3753525.1 mechanosensitive ion channel [Polaromonas sp.]
MAGPVTSRASKSAPIDTLDGWFAALAQPSALTELAALVACVLLAWLLVRVASRSHLVADGNSVLFGRRVIDGVLFPLLLLSFAYGAQILLARLIPVAVFKVAVPVLLSLAVIRLGVKVLQVAFKDAPLVRALERTISWLAWIAMVLWVSGLLPLIMEELDDIKWKVGNSTLSVRTLLEGAVTAGVVLLIALWISAAIETRLLRSATGNELSLRKAVSNATRAVLMFVGLLMALSAVGIDLTALSVLGGAIGVGIGFGLQKLAANYVSGFVMLAERSVRIGDNVRVDDFEGRITNINARYTVVRSLGGRESIVPNEMFISNRIENLSLADSRVLQSTVVSVGYDSDVDLVMRLLTEAALSQDRVVREPGPGVNLTNFGADGLEFTLNYWMTDPENGQQNLRSRINLAILQSLRSNGVEIPYPQRVIHTRSLPSQDVKDP